MVEVSASPSLALSVSISGRTEVDKDVGHKEVALILEGNILTERSLPFPADRVSGPLAVQYAGCRRAR